MSGLLRHIRKFDKFTSVRERDPRISHACKIFTLLRVVRFFCKRLAFGGRFPSGLAFGSHLIFPRAAPSPSRAQCYDHGLYSVNSLFVVGTPSGRDGQHREVFLHLQHNSSLLRPTLFQSLQLSVLLRNPFYCRSSSVRSVAAVCKSVQCFADGPALGPHGNQSSSVTSLRCSSIVFLSGSGEFAPGSWPLARAAYPKRRSSNANSLCGGKSGWIPGNLCNLSKGYFATTFLSAKIRPPGESRTA
jgi:hypothetical protein